MIEERNTATEGKVLEPAMERGEARERRRKVPRTGDRRARHHPKQNRKI